MGRLSRNKELKEVINGELKVVKTGLKNEIIKVPRTLLSTEKGFAYIKTATTFFDEEDSITKARGSFIDLEIADLIVEYDMSVGYDKTKETEENGLTKGYFWIYYNGKRHKLHRFVYKYFKEHMSIDDIFNNKPSICDNKEVHHINVWTYDNRYQNLKLCETVEEHSNYHKRTSYYICLNNDTNKYTVSRMLVDYLMMLKLTNKELKGEFPKDNEDYDKFYDELKAYLKLNENVLGEVDIHFNE